MGKRLISLNGTPDLIISSGAVRALTTAKLFVTYSNYPIDHIKVNDNLYLATSRKIVEIIQLIDNQFSNVWLFSHNPGISETVTDLTDRDVELKTCCLVNIESKINKWREFDFGKCEMKSVFSPKDN
jgi:phosphohistidine phosphatase